MIKLSAIAALILTGTLAMVAQDPVNVLDWKAETTLRTFLLRTMHDQYDARRVIFEQASGSPPGIAEYKEGCRKRYLSLLGTMPDKTPLNPVITGRRECDGYTIENIIYESRPGHHVTSNLYLPSGEGRYPAVLLFCGHEMTSKTTTSYQQTAILFAENGFAVLVVDPISQGERVQFTDAAGGKILRGSTTEHTLLNAGALLTGSSVVAWELYDNIRSLDYLISRPEVDSTRAGCLGNSGGGVQTLYFAAFDERIKVAAPCSFVTSREREYELNGAGDGCQQLPFEGRERLEMADYLLLFAPKPLLILAGRYDFVDYKGTVDASLELEKVYRSLGEGSKFKLFSYDDGHGISEPKRTEAVRWFRSWLCNDTLPIVQKRDEPMDPEQLWCTPDGQVTALYSNEVTVQAMNAASVNDFSDARREFMGRNNPAAVRAELCRLLALSKQESEINAENIASISKPGYIMEKIIIRNQEEVPLPCIILVPEIKCAADTLVILLDHRGKSSVIADSSFIAGISGGQRGVIVLADLRGMGETAEKPQANDPKYYNSEYHNAVLSLHIGQPLPGQRVRDILMLLDYIGTVSSLNERPVKIIATGPAAPAALMAALFNSRITSLELSATISSFTEITARPMAKDWFSYVVPGIMRYFDLPDLAALRPDLKIKYADN